MTIDDKIRDFKVLIHKERCFKNNKKDKVTISEKQATQLVEYVNYLISEGKSDSTIRTMITHIKTFAYFIKKDFKEVTKEDIKKYLKDKQALKPNSVNSIKQRIKIFFKWLYGYEEKGKYPELVSWIKVISVEPQELLKEELISVEETNDILIPACRSFRDKCLLSIMRETGARINEILNANVEDTRLEDDRAFIKLKNSKRRNNMTLYREIVLIDSYYYLNHWLRNHPLKEYFKKKGSISLFVNKKKERMAYHDVMRLLRKLKRETAFKKKVNPHAFRHSQANDMSKILTDAELRVFGGWVKTSQVISRYTHLTSDDVNKKRLESLGRIQSENKETSLENLQTCTRCNEKIDINKFRFCGRCGMSLHKEEEVKETTKMQELENKMNLLFKKFKEQEKKKILREIKKK